jgi:hypothetical protein
VRKSLVDRFPHTTSFRHGLSCMFWRSDRASNLLASRLSEVTCFPAARQAPSLADSLGPCPAPFRICPLMLQKCAFRYFGPIRRSMIQLILRPRGSPPRVHRNPPRIAPPDSRRSLRDARVPPMDFGDDPLQPKRQRQSGGPVLNVAKGPVPGSPALCVLGVVLRRASEHMRGVSPLRSVVLVRISPAYDPGRAAG